MVGLLTAFRKSNPPAPGDRSWVSDFFAEPETQRLWQGGEPNRLNLEDRARARCIEALRKYRKAWRDGNNELAWKHLDHAKELYESLPECRIEMQLALGEFLKGWHRLEGRRMWRLSQHPVFEEMLALHGMDAKDTVAKIEAMQNSKIASMPRGKRKPPGLWERGLLCVLKEAPNITASELIDMAAAGTGARDRVYDYDDDDIRLYLDGNNELVIKDLKTGKKTTPIPTRHLRIYLKRARDRNS